MATAAAAVSADANAAQRGAAEQHSALLTNYTWPKKPGEHAPIATKLAFTFQVNSDGTRGVRATDANQLPRTAGHDAGAGQSGANAAAGTQPADSAPKKRAKRKQPDIADDMSGRTLQQIWPEVPAEARLLIPDLAAGVVAHFGETTVAKACERLDALDLHGKQHRSIMRKPHCAKCNVRLGIVGYTVKDDTHGLDGLYCIACEPTVFPVSLHAVDPCAGSPAVSHDLQQKRQEEAKQQLRTEWKLLEPLHLQLLRTFMRMVEEAAIPLPDQMLGPEGVPRVMGGYAYNGKLVLKLGEFLDGIHPDELTHFRANMKDVTNANKGRVIAAVKSGQYVTFKYRDQGSPGLYPGLAREHSCHNHFIKTATRTATRTASVLIGGSRNVTNFYGLIHPNAVQRADEWCQREYGGKHLWQVPNPSLEMLLKLQKELGAGPDGEQWVLIIRQFERQRVIVPPGWMRVVINQRPCIKVAHDFWNPRNFQLYMRTWREILVWMSTCNLESGNAPVCTTTNAVDHIAAAMIMVKCIVNIMLYKALNR
ncbi:hypothetical protein WJX72_002690 [[Myrmecia] bisecta]|uniref:Transposase n=1 Tax=[Myrmecia] bisecta TaxID=41462 RepID=A0AAW1QEN2_9CHLO